MGWKIDGFKGRRDHDKKITSTDVNRQTDRQVCELADRLLDQYADRQVDKTDKLTESLNQYADRQVDKTDKLTEQHTYR